MTQLEIPGFEKPKHAVVSLSGGMDSSTLLLKCLDKFETVTALSFDYGHKHKVELKRARALVDYLNRQCTDNNCYGGCRIKYQVIKLDGLVDLLDSALVEGGEEVPEGHYAAENMKATVVPNRNKIFASITQAVALSVANRTEEGTSILLISFYMQPLFFVDHIPLQLNAISNLILSRMLYHPMSKAMHQLSIHIANHQKRRLVYRLIVPIKLE